MHILDLKRRRHGTVGEEEHACFSEDLVLWVTSPVKKKNPENEMPFILMVSLNLCLQMFGFLFAYS